MGFATGMCHQSAAAASRAIHMDQGAEPSTAAQRTVGARQLTKLNDQLHCHCPRKTISRVYMNKQVKVASSIQLCILLHINYTALQLSLHCTDDLVCVRHQQEPQHNKRRPFLEIKGQSFCRGTPVTGINHPLPAACAASAAAA